MKFIKVEIFIVLCLKNDLLILDDLGFHAVR